MKSNILKNKTLWTLLLFTAYLAVIWLPFIDYFSKQQLTKIDHKSPPGYLLNDSAFDDILAIDSWANGLTDSPSGSALWYDRAAQRGSYNGVTTIKFHPFSTEHLISGNSSWLLSVHGLSVVKTALYAFIESEDTYYLTAAIEYLNNYIKFERSQNFDQGFVFNDHAVAARVYTTTLLWRHYRNSALRSPEKTQLILYYLYELNSRLMNPRFYNHKSNHGTMQNIALMLYATAFSDLPDSQHWGTIGKQRLEQQLGYLVSPEGFFLEHSFGYQGFIISLLEAAKRYGEIDSRLVSEIVNDSLTRMETLNSNLIRQDGTLPVMGDTSAGKRYPNDLVRTRTSTQTAPADTLFPVAGFLLLDRSFSAPHCYSTQNNRFYLTLFWSNYFRHGHKRWDDMSLDFWACGTQWWRNIGYVPYWHPLRESSETWFGSNAPHLLNEGKPQPNSSELTLSIDSVEVDYAQTRRRLDTGAIYRDTLRIDNVLFVRDFFNPDSNSDQFTLETNWTLDHHKKVDQIGPAEYLIAGSSGNEMRSLFIYDAQGDIKTLSGTQDSSLGWVEYQKNLYRTHTIQSRSTGLMPALTHISQITPAVSSGECSWSFGTQAYTADAFDFELQLCDKRYRVAKKNNHLTIETDERSTSYPLQRLNTDFRTGIRSVNLNTNLAFDEYGNVFITRTSYRLKVSYLGIALFMFTLLMQLLAFLLTSPAKQRILFYASGSCWVLLIAWVNFIYFG